MTTVATRTPTVLDGEFVETTTRPPRPLPAPKLQAGPHRAGLNVSAAGMGLSVTGFIYTVAADTAAKLPAFVLAMALIATCAVYLLRYAIADRALEVVTDTATL
jgi:hypothetical protein